ncbi:S8 family serine peptidase [bacterium]
MIKTITAITGWIAIFSCTVLLGQVNGKKTAIPPYHPNQIIVKYRTETPKKVTKENQISLVGLGEIDSLNVLYQCRDISRLYKQTPKKKGYEELRLDRVYIYTFDTIENIDTLIRDYIQTGYFEYVEPNYTGKGGGRAGITPNDAYFYRQWSMKNDGTYPSSHPGKADADIDMDDAWQWEQGSTSAVGAILDSGCKLDHPEFAGRIWKNSGDLTVNGADDDGNGYIDDMTGWDFANDDNNPADDHGHGTNVAGIAGATGNNSNGYAGVDWNCKLMVCKILNSENWGYYSWWIAAIEYAVANGAHAMNMSVGGSSFSAALQDAVNLAYQNDITICACMMNEDNDAPYYPAAYANTIAVGATDTDDTRCDPFFWGGGSNWGNHIDVVAPGNYIYGLNKDSDTNYDWYWGGTSQATPHVMGLVTLLWAQDNMRTPDDMRMILRNTAEDQVGDAGEDVQGFDPYYGYGRINANSALQVTGVDISSESTPSSLTMTANYPNPFNPATTIHFKIDKPGHVRFQIFNVRGQQIRQLLDGYKNKGHHTVIWDGKDDGDHSMPAGTYIARLQTGKNITQKKMILLR